MRCLARDWTNDGNFAPAGIDARHSACALASPHGPAVAHHVMHAGNRALRRRRAPLDAEAPCLAIAHGAVARACFEQPHAQPMPVFAHPRLEALAWFRAVVTGDDFGAGHGRRLRAIHSARSQPLRMPTTTKRTHESAIARTAEALRIHSAMAPTRSTR